MKTLFRLIPILILFISANLTAETVTATSYAGGDGTEANPYQISNLAELRRLSETTADWDKHFIQTADIDATDTEEWNSGAGFSPIGNGSTQFTGSYNGRYHTITELTINVENATSRVYTGMFGYVSGGTLDSISLEGGSITASSPVSAGCLVGSSSNSSISNSYATGAVTASSSSHSVCAGGLVGYSDSSSISNSYACGAVTSSSSSSAVYTGGLVGSSNSSSISNSYSTGAVTSSSLPSSIRAGGLVGNFSSNSSICNSYATGAVTASLSSTSSFLKTVYAGGLVGYSLYSSISNSYATGAVTASFSSFSSSSVFAGGLVGRSSSYSISNSYATGAVKASSYSSPSSSSSHYVFAGGLVGSSSSYSISNSYANGSVKATCYFSSHVYEGGLLGSSDSYYISNSYYDCETTGMADVGIGNGSGDVTGLTTAEFLSKDFSSIWPFGNSDDNPWVDDGANSYPKLWWEDLPFYGGKGTLENPYQISKAEQLLIVGKDNSYWDKHFVITADIDMTGQVMSPIGNQENKFTGSFDGSGFVIKNLTVGAQKLSHAGLFGYTDSATIDNVSVTNAEVTGELYVGAIVGWASKSTITNCFVTGCITAYSVDSFSIGGGIVGSSVQSTVANCYADVQVKAECAKTGDDIGPPPGGPFRSTIYSIAGGMAGYSGGSLVRNCFTTGNVYSTANNYHSYSGGLVGANWASGSFQYSILNCYSKASVESGPSARVSCGGLVGLNQYTKPVINCYAIGKVKEPRSGVVFIGGVVGENNNTILENCFWNKESTGQPSSAGSDDSYGLRTDDFLAKDFSSLWSFGSENNKPWGDYGDNSYPHLYWQLDFSDNDFFDDTEIGLSLFKNELELFGIVGLVDRNLSLYQEELYKHHEMIQLHSELIQDVVDAVNEGDNIAMITVSEGWNLISSPYEGWSINDSVLLKQHAEPYLFNYSNCKYRYNHKSTVLRPGVGYWIYLDGLEEGEEYPVLISGKKVDDESIHLQQDWNLVGLKAEQQVPEDGEELYAESIMGVYGWNCFDGTYSEIEDVMELGYGYWILCEEDALLN